MFESFDINKKRTEKNHITALNQRQHRGWKYCSHCISIFLHGVGALSCRIIQVGKSTVKVIEKCNTKQPLIMPFNSISLHLCRRGMFMFMLCSCFPISKIQILLLCISMTPVLWSSANSLFHSCSQFRVSFSFLYFALALFCI